MRIIQHPWQRIILHAICLCRRPRNSLFHLHGIAREIPLPDALLLVFSAAAAIATQALVHQYTKTEARLLEGHPQTERSFPRTNEWASLEEPTQAFRKQYER